MFTNQKFCSAVPRDIMIYYLLSVPIFISIDAIDGGSLESKYIVLSITVHIDQMKTRLWTYSGSRDPCNKCVMRVR